MEKSTKSVCCEMIGMQGVHQNLLTNFIDNFTYRIIFVILGNKYSKTYVFNIVEFGLKMFPRELDTFLAPYYILNLLNKFHMY